MFRGSTTVKQGTHCCISMATMNNFCISESYIYASNNKMETYCFVSMATMAIQVCHKVTWYVESSWNVMAHGEAREGKWRGNWRMEWVASSLHTTSEHAVSSITTADAHTSVASSRLNWRPRRFKWTRPFRLKTKSGFCACAITFQTQSTSSEHAQSLPWSKQTNQGTERSTFCSVN